MKSDYSWLEKWSNSLSNQMVLELGCGDGVDTKSIVKFAKSIVACDLEPPQAIEGVSNIMMLDHSESLPFENESFNVVIASLCLHYFGWPTTRNIVTEISRVLSKGGSCCVDLTQKMTLILEQQGTPRWKKVCIVFMDNQRGFSAKLIY